MNLIYVSTDTDISVNSGVVKKIKSQLHELEQLGFKVTHYSSKRYLRNKYLNFLTSRLLTPIRYYHFQKDFDENVIVYLRREYHHITYLPFIVPQRRYKTVFEIQCIEKDEYLPKYRGSSLIYLINALNYLELLCFDSYLKNHVDGIVSVTDEISNNNKKITNARSQYLTLGNGIDTTRIEVRRITSLSDSELHVLCVALVAKWHGIDRFIRGLHEYNAHYANSTKIVLHIVGDGPELPYLKELTTELNLQDRVIFHGFKSGKELDEMFDMCHIALDALAGFRKGLTELSSLKSREYCARGIPFLMASKDADFPEGFNWIQMVPADEQPIDMNTVVNFTNRMMADPEHPQKMRRYAEEHLDWMAKMKVLKEFLESL